ncbi:MAG: hypothetical protein OXF33_06910 [Rhodospirillales bacterium]|nr:hypothetical protein [Rhodospirillales bacterium]
MLARWLEQEMAIEAVVHDQAPEARDICGAEHVQPDLLPQWALETDHPTLPADLDGNMQRGRPSASAGATGSCFWDISSLVVK